MYELYKKNRHRVRLGETNFTTDIDCDSVEKQSCGPPHQDIEVEGNYVHENYNIVSKAYDIALIKLKQKAKLIENSVSTICLPKNDIKTFLANLVEEEEISEDEVDKFNFTVAGWGKINETHRSDHLLFAHVTYLDGISCTTSYEEWKRRNIIHPRLIQDKGNFV